MLKKNVKADFPVLQRKINNHNLVYLDNAATTQSPKVVIDSFVEFYSNHRANVHRGVHTLSEESTNLYEEARKSIAVFLGCSYKELAFVKNATEGANLVAFSFIPNNLKKGDTILLSKHEHHSNILPWLEVSKRLGLCVKYIPFDNNFKIDLSKLKDIDFNFMAINHVSNFLGSVTNINEVSKICKQKKAYLFVDGAQGIPHCPVNVSNMGCDFYTFSGHKIYAPFGTGALYIKESLLEKMSEFMYGGGMITYVWEDKAAYLENVEKYDAGTPNVGGAITLASALNYYESLNKVEIFNHEKEVLEYLFSQLSKVGGIEIYGPKNLHHRVGLVSFNLAGVHGHDLASILDTFGVAVRSGQHCTILSHNCLNINSSVRASIGLYNFKDDVDCLIQGIKYAKKILT